MQAQNNISERDCTWQDDWRKEKKKIVQTGGAVVINSVGVIISRCVRNHFVRVQRETRGGGGEEVRKDVRRLLPNQRLYDI